MSQNSGFLKAEVAVTPGLWHGAAQGHPEPAGYPCLTAALPLSPPCLLPYCSHSHPDICKKCQESTEIWWNPDVTASRNLLSLMLQEKQPTGKSLFQFLFSRQDWAGMAPGWPISSSTLWKGAGKEDCRETPTPVAALSPAHHLKLSQKPGEGPQGQARRAVGALQMEKAAAPKRSCRAQGRWEWLTGGWSYSIHQDVGRAGFGEYKCAEQPSVKPLGLPAWQRSSCTGHLGSEVNLLQSLRA